MASAGIVFSLRFFALFGFLLCNNSLAIRPTKKSFTFSSPLPGNITAPLNSKPNDERIQFNIANQPQLVNVTTFSLSHNRPAFIAGLRVEETERRITYDEENVLVVPAGTLVPVRLFGHDFSYASQFRFVLVARERGANCDDLPFSANINISQSALTWSSAVMAIRLSMPDQIDNNNDSAAYYYICSMGKISGQSHWIHQGKEPGVMVRTYQKSLPLWIQIVIIIILLVLSGLFSGLNLGLMALDPTDLKIYENTGSDKEKIYARAISPVRNHGNYLLCTLLLGNVLVNSTLTILLDDLTSGVIAVIGSTICIVIFGEILPQSICCRHGLAVGAYSIWITKFFMLVTFPLSYPISLFLDLILGEEIGSYYNRERLNELIKVTNKHHDLERDEMNIISGALEMRKKTVGSIMTRLEEIFMLSYDSLMDFETISDILKQGFSRVPIYDGIRSNIVGMLSMKELALVDPREAIPLKTICRFYQRKCCFVHENTPLDVVFKDFKEGIISHIAFVQRMHIHPEDVVEPIIETIGLITWEDVIEQLIQGYTAEMVVKTDAWMNKDRDILRRKKSRLFQDFSSFAAQYRDQAIRKISPQLALSAFQFLSSIVAPFQSDCISEHVLRRLLQQDPVVQFVRIKKQNSKSKADAHYIYQQGKPIDYFVLILEGRVEVTIGSELVFENGPFIHFGAQTLREFDLQKEDDLSKSVIKYSQKGIISTETSQKFSKDDETNSNTSRQVCISDYTVRALTDVTYLRISQILYQAARNATLLERNEITQSTIAETNFN